jgi:hypothetical protein
MGAPTSKIENPTASRDLRLLYYLVNKKNEAAFIQYYKTTITAYLIDHGVKDTVVWSVDQGENTLYAFATSPTVPPWYESGVLDDLRRLTVTNSSVKLTNIWIEEFTQRRDLQIHEPEKAVTQNSELMSSLAV